MSESHQHTPTALDNSDKVCVLMWLLASTIYSLSLQDLIIDLCQRVSSLEKTLKEALETFKGGRSPLEDVVKQEGAKIINGINVLRIPSRDAYSYGLRLMDIIFSKEEMG